MTYSKQVMEQKSLCSALKIHEDAIEIQTGLSVIVWKIKGKLYLMTCPNILYFRVIYLTLTLSIGTKEEPRLNRQGII